ncbi:methyltransferase [Orbaceae bacterium ESL0727]|nr:methyltransferase [Orbaceae bacterium ESL0727]
MQNQPHSNSLIGKKIATESLKPGGFTFKRFFVAHDNSPMKVTTDSVLLGAWAPLEPIPLQVLDIGTGCGVIGLMLAQRLEQFTASYIDVIDIDVNAIKDCEANICCSPFHNIRAIHQDIRQWADNHQHEYDLIVCNPPYFQSATACRNQQRQTARYTEQLNHTQLFTVVEQLLTAKGRFCVVLPFRLADDFIQLGCQTAFSLVQRLDVSYSEDKGYSLVLLCFMHEKNMATESHTYKHAHLCMRHADHSYTEAFTRLLKDFYLRF